MSDPRVVVKLFTSCASILMPDPSIQDVCDDTIAPLTWRAFCGVFVLIPTPDGALIMKELSCDAFSVFMESMFIAQILFPIMFALNHIAKLLDQFIIFVLHSIKFRSQFVMLFSNPIIVEFDAVVVFCCHSI